MKRIETQIEICTDVEDNYYARIGERTIACGTPASVREELARVNMGKYTIKSHKGAIGNIFPVGEDILDLIRCGPAPRDERIFRQSTSF